MFLSGHVFFVLSVNLSFSGKCSLLHVHRHDINTQTQADVSSDWSAHRDATPSLCTYEQVRAHMASCLSLFI